MKRIYKYVGHSYLEKVLGGSQQITLKCSYPKDFNDPYELFLTINFNESPELLAFYSDVIGELPQIPTTCFSRSPLVIPMWAHYAQNHAGIAIEFEEAELMKHFPESGFGDVDYQDAPNSGLNDLLGHAFGLQKPRHIHMLQTGVFTAAYYTKASCWAYEHERRMVVPEAGTRSAGEMILIDVPSNCVKALICGARATSETATTIRAQADQFGCSFFQLRIGRTSATPYLVDAKGKAFGFDNGGIVECGAQCVACGEPTHKESEQCSWCQIDESHKHEAASRNTYRLLAKYGLLEDYSRGMREIDEKFRRKE